MNIEAIIKILRETPLNISSTRRGGANGLRNANEIAEKIMLLVYKDRIGIATIQGSAEAIIESMQWEEFRKEGIIRTATKIKEKAEKLLEE